jgi:hypothetical protein
MNPGPMTEKKTAMWYRSRFSIVTAVAHLCRSTEITSSAVITPAMLPSS